MKKLIAVAAGAAMTLLAAPAFAGEWRLDPRRCPDLREDRWDRRDDRRDERVDYGRRDRAEDRYDRREGLRDRSITVCPRSAFVYLDDWRDRRDGYEDRGDRRDGRRDEDWRDRGDGSRDGYRDSRRRPKLTFEYDRRLRMHYRYDSGRRIYVRG